MATLGAAGIAAIVSAGAATASFVAQTSAAKESAKQQQKANDINRASATVENARRRRRAIAQARVAQAENMANQSTSVQTSSAQVGVNSALSSQAGANIGTSIANMRSQNSVFNAQQSSANAIRRGNTIASGFQALGSVAQSGAKAYDEVYGNDLAKPGPDLRANPYMNSGR